MIYFRTLQAWATTIATFSMVKFDIVVGIVNRGMLNIAI